METTDSSTTNVSNRKKTPLSAELTVACEIHHHNIRGEPVWYNKLVDSLDEKTLERSIADSIITLFDWGMLRTDHFKTPSGKIETTFKVSDDYKHIVVSLYDTWWKNSN